jgi:hypothetical protein
MAAPRPAEWAVPPQPATWTVPTGAFEVPYTTTGGHTAATYIAASTVTAANKG